MLADDARAGVCDDGEEIQMRDPKRIPRIIKKLEKVWKMHPDYRLGQLVSNLQGPGVQDVFFKEDDEWEDILDHVIE
jgi:hypothetical protein